MLREYLNSVGREDQKEHLAERLSLPRIAAAGLQNSSWFTLLGPGSDTAWSRVLGQESLFDARTTQQPSEAILGNPTVGLFDAVQKVPKAIAGVFQGDFSQVDARKLKTILAFQNLMGITQINNLLVRNLPEFRVN